MKYLVINFLLMWCPIVLISQNYDIKYQLTSVNCETRQVCYDVQLRSNGSSNFNLAGQNYRIYYNSNLASYTSGVSLLPIAYGDFVLVQNVQGANADAVNGPLTFESTLGFLNYAIDLNDTQNGGLVLTSNEWTSTSHLCFDVSESVFSDTTSCLELIWARKGLTDVYATAFVEASRWVSTNNTTNANGILYDDLDATDGASSCLYNRCQFANITISDMSVIESNGSAEVQICTDQVSAKDITVLLTTMDSTAMENTDYVSVDSALVTIAAGQTCSPVWIPIVNDSISEPTEVLKVRLSHPSSNATISDGIGLVRITDDESIPNVLINDITVNEDIDTINLSVCLSGLSSQPTTMQVSTSDSTAVAGMDYQSFNAITIVIPSGQLCTKIPLVLLDDTIQESSELLRIVITDVSIHATINRNVGWVTITDNDVTCQAKAPVITGK
jgi:hypothetical protein